MKATEQISNEYLHFWLSRRFNEAFERKLARDFYDRPADSVARDLIGKILCVRQGSRILRSRIIETEAYLGRHDKACHAHKGLTKRTAVMFGPPGYAYIYFVYGVHHMLNVVTHREGEPHAVLIRATDSSLHFSDRELNGPGKLTKAFRINSRHNSLDLCGDDLFILDAAELTPIVKTPRIGISYAGEWAKKPLRYIWKHAPHFKI